MQTQKGISTLTGIIIIVAVVVVAVSGVFAYQYFTKTQIPMTNVQPNLKTQNSNVQNPNPETAGWKTYIDPQQRFSIQYPSDWQNIQDVKKDDVIFCANTDENCALNAIYIYVYTKGGAAEILNYWRKQGSEYKETSLTVDNRPAIEREEDYCKEYPLTNGIFISGSSYDYQVQGPVSKCGFAHVQTKESYDAVKNIIDKMLSTFKFTN